MWLELVKNSFERLIRHERDRAIFMSAMSAFGAKFGGVVLQLFSIPLVVRTLGVQDFAIFAIGSSIIAFVMISNLGISGYIITAIAGARNSNGGLEDISGIISTALFVTVISGTLLLLATHLYSTTVGLEYILGGLYIYAPETITHVFYFILIVGALQSVSTIFVAAQNAYQELYYSNLYGGGANLISALTIAAYYFLAEETKVLGYLLAFYLPMLLCQLINAAHFLCRHPEARPKLKLLNGLFLKSALCSGGAFFVAQTVLPISIREFPKFILAARGDLSEVTSYALLMTLWTILSGFVMAFTQPLFGGISDAWSNGEQHWILRRIVISVSAYLLIGLRLMIIGHYFGFKLTSIWVGDDAAIENQTMLLFGLSFGLAGVFHLLTITIYAISLKFQCMMLNLVISLCVFLSVLALGQSIDATCILVVISAVIGCIGVPLGFYWSRCMDWGKFYDT